MRGRGRGKGRGKGRGNAAMAAMGQLGQWLAIR